ncbi:MAG: response regulator [Opitutaceae bacterium]
MSSTLSRPLVLLVEDSEDDAFFFRWTLDKCGFACEVVHAIDGAAAIQRLEAVLAGTSPHPDLVFLDLKIPTFSGFEILAWIRDRRFEPPLDVAVLSGSEHVGDIQRAHSLGATAYYVKPLSVEQLRARFNRLQTSREAPDPSRRVDVHAWADPNGKE